MGHEDQTETSEHQADFFFAFTLAHRALCAAAIFLRAAAESAIFQEVKKTSRLGVLQENNVRIIVATQGSETLSIRRQAE